jgi:hypothetical protein
MIPDTLRVFKFVVPNDRFYHLTPADGEALTYRGCMAVVIAESIVEARDLLEEDAAGCGEDMRWLAIAKTYQLPIKAGVVAVVMI